MRSDRASIVRCGRSSGLQVGHCDRVCANFAARPVFHHGAPCVAAANGARRSLPMASTACVSPSASLRLPLPHGCQDIFTDTRSACLSGFQGSMPLRAQTAKGGSLKACPERSRTDPQDLGMDRLAEAFPYGCATPIRHPQSSVALRFEAATHMPRYFHTHLRSNGLCLHLPFGTGGRPAVQAQPRRNSSAAGGFSIATTSWPRAQWKTLPLPYSSTKAIG